MPVQSISQNVPVTVPSQPTVIEPVQPTVIEPVQPTVIEPVQQPEIVNDKKIVKQILKELEFLDHKLDSLDSNDPKYNELQIEFNEKKKQLSTSKGTTSDTFYRSDALNLKFDESLCQGFYLENWKTNDSKWTETPKAYDDTLANNDYVIVNGLRIKFRINIDNYMTVSIKNNKTSLSRIAHDTTSIGASENTVLEEAPFINWQTVFEWTDDKDVDDTITADAYFKFNVLKIKANGSVETARIDYFSRIVDGTPVLAMQLLIFWKDSNKLFSEIEFRPKYYLDTALGDPSNGGWIGWTTSGSYGQCQLSTQGILTRTMKQLKQEGVWTTTGSSRDLFDYGYTRLRSSDQKNDSMYIRFMHASFGKVPRTT